MLQCNEENRANRQPDTEPLPSGQAGPGNDVDQDRDHSGHRTGDRGGDRHRPSGESQIQQRQPDQTGDAGPRPHRRSVRVTADAGTTSTPTASSPNPSN